MVAYSFQQQFVAPILAGTKQQTIRAVSHKRHARDGEMVQLYTGLRTRSTHLIGSGKCTAVRPITIWVHQAEIKVGDGAIEAGDGLFRLSCGLDGFARRDGFEDWQAMRRFWEEHHPTVAVFTGVLIRWNDLMVGQRVLHRWKD